MRNPSLCAIAPPSFDPDLISPIPSCLLTGMRTGPTLFSDSDPDPSYASALELARNKTVSSLWSYGDDLLQTFAPGANLTVAMVLATGQETATWLRCRFSHGDPASELDCSPWQSIRSVHTQTCLSNCVPDFAVDDDKVQHRGTWWVVDEHLNFLPFSPAVDVCAPDGRQDLVRSNSA